MLNKKTFERMSFIACNRVKNVGNAFMHSENGTDESVPYKYVRRTKGFYRAAKPLGEMAEQPTGLFLCRSLCLLPFLVRIPPNK